MILQDLFATMGGAPRQASADPMDQIKDGLLAQLLGKVKAAGEAVGGLAAVDPVKGLEAGPGGMLSDIMAKLGGGASAPAPIQLSQAPAQGPAATDQAPLAPALAPKPNAWTGTDQAPAPDPALSPRLPDMPVKDIGPQAAFGAPYAPPPPEAAPAPGQTAPPPGGAPGAPQAQRFEPTMGQRLRAFGRALQGADPGDPGQAAEVKNQTMQFLMAKGMAPQDAQALVSNPALLQAALPGLFQGRITPKIDEIYDAQGRKQKAIIDPATGNYKTIGGVAGDEGKPPSGFEWVNPNDHKAGLKAIQGGPATHLTAELSGKLALMDAAQQNIGKSKDALLKNWGPSGALQSFASKVPFVGDIAPLSGDIGIASRDVRAGIEAALRVMTGAAAPEQEVTRYMELFMPGIRDNDKSAAQKLDLLDKFMNNAREMVTRGRTATPGPGGAGNGAPGAGPQAPQGAAPPRDTALSEARAAIAAGKNPDAVRARLAQWGYSLD